MVAPCGPPYGTKTSPVSATWESAGLVARFGTGTLLVSATLAAAGVVAPCGPPYVLRVSLVRAVAAQVAGGVGRYTTSGGDTLTLPTGSDT